MLFVDIDLETVTASGSIGQVFLWVVNIDEDGIEFGDCLQSRILIENDLKRNADTLTRRIVDSCDIYQESIRDRIKAVGG